MSKKQNTNSGHIDCSIIIPHYQQTEDLTKCLGALIGQQTTYKYEVIVVDNDSPLNSRVYVQFPEVIFLTNQVKNPYASRNMGIQYARSNYIGFLDARCTPKVDWLENGMQQLQTNQQSIIAGKYLVIPPTSALKDLVYGLLYLNNEKNVREGYGVTTGNLFVAKSLFEKVGYFKDTQISGNDIEWSKRAISRGYHLLYAPETIVTIRGQSFTELIRKTAKYAVGIRAQHKSWQQKTQSFLTYLLPMRWKNFQESLTYRSLDGLMWKNKWYLWLLVWTIKVRLALAYLFHK